MLRWKYSESDQASWSLVSRCTFFRKKNISRALSYQPSLALSILSLSQASVPKPKYAVEISERYSRRDVFTKIESENMFT